MAIFFLFILLASVNLPAAVAEHGVFMIVDGEVQIENVQGAVPAKVNSKIQSGESVITNEGRAKIVMTDRNVIVVMPNSRLKIERYSNTPEDKNVTLNLVEGTIRTDVEQNYDDENSMFEVRTPTATVGVRGTQFITSYTKDGDATEVTTLRGRVRFKDGKTDRMIFINKGERFRVRLGRFGKPTRLSETEFKRIDLDSKRTLRKRLKKLMRSKRGHK